MSNQTQIYLDNAILAKASYAYLKKETCEQDRIDNIIALERECLTRQQAIQLLNRYEVLDVLNDSVSGASAIIVRDNNTGKATLSIRGTDDIVDCVVSDSIITIPTLSQLLLAEQYLTIKNFYDHAITKGNIGASETISVTGHSLGGFLATCFTLLNQKAVNNTFTYNAPGFGGYSIRIYDYRGYDAQ